MIRRWQTLGGLSLLLLLLVGLTAQADSGEVTVTLVFGGCTDGYLEPCGCGGQNAGGVARRAAMVAAVRQREPGAAYLDLGRLGPSAAHAAVAAAVAARLGAVAVGCGTAEALLPAHHDLARSAALPLTHLAPPGDALPAMVCCELAPGVRVGVISVCLGPLAGAELAARCEEVAGAALAQGAVWWVLLSHLDRATTERMVRRLPAARRPAVVALALLESEPHPPWTTDGTTWVTVAAKGRSLSTITATRQAAGWRYEAATEMVLDGPRDPLVQGWVDAAYAAQKASEAAQVDHPAPALATAAVAACEPCHRATVAAWRQHPHGQAVATLEQAGRDVAACLRCHDESLRRTGVRSRVPGEQGVTCVACHGQLERHVQTPAVVPTTVDPAACQECHTAEHSAHWDPTAYRAAVAAVCGGR